MTLRQYYRAALLFPLIPPAISWPLAYLSLPSNRGAAEWAGMIAFVSLAGLVFYVPCALLFAYWEFRHPIAPRRFTLVVLAFPPACFLLAFVAVIVVAIARRDEGFGDLIRAISLFGTIIVTVGYLYVAIILGIAAVCRRYGYITPDPDQGETTETVVSG